MRALPLLTLLACFALLCSSLPYPEPNVCSTQQCQDAAESITKAIDPNVNPCDDFYGYACGNWIANHPIPETEPESISALGLANRRNVKIVRTILESAEPPVAIGTKVREAEQRLFDKVKTFYATCMDTTARESTGAALVKSIGDKYINAFEAKSPDSKGVDGHALARVLLDQVQDGFTSLFSATVAPDLKEPTKNRITLVHNGISAFGSAVYAIESITDVYTSTIAKVFKHLYKDKRSGGDSDADYDALAKGIVTFESGLYQAMTLSAGLTEPIQLYNPIAVDDLAKMSPSLPWEWYLSEMARQQGNREFNRSDPIIVQTPKYFASLDAIIKSTPTSAISGYFAWRAIETSSSVADQATQALWHDLATAMGTKIDQSPDTLAKQCIEAADLSMGFALGRWYVAQAFGGDETRQAVASKVEQISQSFIQRVQSSTWLDPMSKEKAIVKAKVMHRNIAFPPITQDLDALSRLYGPLAFEKGDVFGNQLRLTRWIAREQWAKLGQLNDLGEWPAFQERTTPMSANAAYMGSRNSLLFPAGALQRPLFSLGVPDALNFGAYGAVAGHEITHGFDPSGSQYDAQGRYAPWLSEQAKKEFDSRSQCFADQYSKMTVAGPNNTRIPVNGVMTLAENVADNGGVAQSYAAWKATEPKDLRLPGPLRKLTSDQLFFVGWAHMWCENARPEYEVVRAQRYEHAPGVARVNGVAQNSQDFARAFQCPAGAPMNPATKCELW